MVSLWFIMFLIRIIKRLFKQSAELNLFDAAPHQINKEQIVRENVGWVLFSDLLTFNINVQ